MCDGKIIEIQARLSTNFGQDVGWKTKFQILQKKFWQN